MLSWGMAVEDIERHYLDESEGMFARSALLERWKSKYTADNITGFF